MVVVPGVTALEVAVALAVAVAVALVLFVPLVVVAVGVPVVPLPFWRNSATDKPVPASMTSRTMKATTGDFLVEREFPKAKRKTFKSEEDAVAALRKKKVDMFISDSTLIWYLAGTHANDGVVGIPIALSEEVLGWATRKSDDKILAAANSFIEKASENGKLNEVYRRWMAIPK